ncbi:hypothetical protein EVAR_64659_1 [Eumeta japonica]|uniref:Uncharacterized protein n=1 Tax=Eumeta variegata TaxID=151549 RepID=A0A4C2A6H8_EUMVA|nr:hypothetical protein EVAR_64659_1 [Eumeta japonica]
MEGHITVCFDHTAHGIDVFGIHHRGRATITEINTSTELEFCKPVINSLFAWCFIAKGTVMPSEALLSCRITLKIVDNFPPIADLLWLEWELKEFTLSVDTIPTLVKAPTAVRMSPLFFSRGEFRLLTPEKWFGIYVAHFIFFTLVVDDVSILVACRGCVHFTDVANAFFRVRVSFEGVIFQDRYTDGANGMAGDLDEVPFVKLT